MTRQEAILAIAEKMTENLGADNHAAYELLHDALKDLASGSKTWLLGVAETYAQRGNAYLVYSQTLNEISILEKSRCERLSELCWFVFHTLASVNA